MSYAFWSTRAQNSPKNTLTPMKPKVNSNLDILLDNRFSSLKVTTSQNVEIEMSQVATQQILEDSDSENETESPQDLESLKQNIQMFDSARAEQVSSLEFTQAQVDEIKSENKTFLLYLKDIELELQGNTYAIEKLETKQTTFETSFRKKNIIVEGLVEAERGHETIPDTVSNLFQAMGIQTPINYDQDYRIGPYNDRRTRSLFISFMKISDRNYVFAQRSQLIQSPNHYNVWINDDVSPEGRQNRNVIRQLTRAVKETGAQCTSTQQAIIIEKNNRKEKLRCSQS